MHAVIIALIGVQRSLPGRKYIGYGCRRIDVILGQYPGMLLRADDAGRSMRKADDCAQRG
jgi:hypothetical protein